MDKQQTAVEWLVAELNSEINYIPMVQWDRIRDLVQRAKAMEKEQIIDAWSNGYDEEDRASSSPLKYYNETYGGTNS